MFVWQGKFQMAAAFLDGYATAVQEADTELHDFREWLAQRFY